LKVVAVNRILEAQERYPNAHQHLQGWYHIMRKSEFQSPEELRKAFGYIRGFKNSFKFPIPETTLLAITFINFDAQVVLVDDVVDGNTD
jgi:mRNA-degrading endonuclease HigB of HigAB toxin-antitoxin module